MPVHIQGYASNKAPGKHPSPDKALYQTSYTTKEGEVIWRSLPRPDRLTFRATLSKAHFGKGGAAEPAAEDDVAKLAEGLAGAQEFHAESKPYTPKGSYPRKFHIPLGPRDSNVFIEIQSSSPVGGPVQRALRIEMTPRKLQLDGLAQFLETLFYAAPSPFLMGAFLHDCRLSRVDAAVDFVGVQVDQLLATVGKSGKRMDIYGASERLESTYLFRAKKLATKPVKTLKKPLGAMAVRIYDRNAERAAHGKPPPVEGQSVTRIEASVTRFGKPFQLSDLPYLKNPFASTRLSFAPDLALSDQNQWMSYVGLRRAFGDQEACSYLGLTQSAGLNYRKAWGKHKSLLLPATIWSEWADGLHYSGMAGIIGLAKSGSWDVS